MTHIGNIYFRLGVKLNAYRLPTDNDGRQNGTLDGMGLRNLKVTPGEWTATPNDNGSVTLTVNNTYIGSGNSPMSFKTRMSYTIMPDGVIAVSSIIMPSRKNVIIPRIGFTFDMPKEYERYAWFGRGPWENYRDRKESCFPGLSYSTVTDQWTPYILHQETGNKEDVRFSALTDENGKGIMVNARYFRLVAHSEVNNNAWSSAAEVGRRALRKVDPESDTSGTKIFYYIRE